MNLFSCQVLCSDHGFLTCDHFLKFEIVLACSVYVYLPSYCSSDMMNIDGRGPDSFLGYCFDGLKNAPDLK